MKGTDLKHTKSITFTFVSQFGANFEIEFLIVCRDCWLTLIFQKEIRFPENQIFRKRFAPLRTQYVSLLLSPLFTGMWSRRQLRI